MHVTQHAIRFEIFFLALSRFKGILLVLSDGIEGLLGVLQFLLGEVRVGEGLSKLRVVDDYGDRALRFYPHLQHVYD